MAVEGCQGWRRWAVWAGVVIVWLSAAAAGQGQSTLPTTVVVVRHAEKAAVPGDDPPLSEAGHARARALRAALADASVTAVVVSPRIRTHETARPLAPARRPTPAGIGPADGNEA